MNKKFLKFINMNPDVLIRYSHDGKGDMSYGSNDIKSQSIPKCHCGGERQFLCQIMPSVLSYLEPWKHLDLKIS